MSNRQGADGRTNRRTRGYSDLMRGLPQGIHMQAVAMFEDIFLLNPQHPSLRLHQLRDNAKGHHLPGSFSVSITMRYRAIYVVDEVLNENVWYWVGTHADYDKFVGNV